MTNNPNDQKSGGIGGFLLGALIGGSIVFLLGTKKGRKLLHALTEEGLEGIAGIEDLIQSNPEEELELTEEQTVPEIPTIIQPKEEAKKSEKKQSAVVRVSKRFFRGIPKKR